MRPRRPDTGNPLRPARCVHEIQVVGAVSRNVLAQLGVETSARSVWLHPDVVLHIGEQRAAKKRRIETGDAAFALRHLPATILRADYCGLDRRDARGRRIDLV